MALSLKTFETQLLGIIGATTGITDLVVTRYYNARLPQLTSFPALVFTVVDINGLGDKDSGSDYDIIRVQFNCYGSRQSDASELYDAVRTQFDRYTGTGNLTFHETFFKGRQPTQQDFDTKIYWCSVDFDFHIKA